MSKYSPKLRTATKIKPPYPLNDFPKNFGFNVGKEIIYLLATKRVRSIEGKEWEQIFAESVGARWKPSNVGLDDIALENCAWGAKTIKSSNPAAQIKVRLISGRNSPVYSYGDSKITEIDPNELGEKILEIWNERVSSARQIYKHLRTVVLIKAKDFTSFVIFEFETIRYDNEKYVWKWNERNNLEGYEKGSNEHVFTWQPSGSQFTIIEKVPEKKIIINVKTPKLIDKSKFLDAIGFNKNWIEVIKNGR